MGWGHCDRLAIDVCQIVLALGHGQVGQGTGARTQEPDKRADTCKAGTKASTRAITELITSAPTAR
ncbi:hypothetical protein JOE62_000086 [Glutamicibacter nicotianae]|nr:hypothetical protein [Glutamicibacter nicotianae]